MRLSSPLHDPSWTTNSHIVQLVQLEIEVKYWEETTSRIERIRRQPVDIVIGALQRRIRANDWSL